MKSTLISLQALLCEPIPDDPQDAEVATHWSKKILIHSIELLSYGLKSMQILIIYKNGDLIDGGESSEEESYENDESSDEITKKSKQQAMAHLSNKFRNRSKQKSKPKFRTLKDVSDAELYGISEEVMNVFLLLKI